MMFKSFLLVILLSFNMYAHKIQGFELVVTATQTDEILIEAKMKNSQKRLYGNKVHLISMVDSRILFEGILNKGLKIQIPNESYWVYVYIGDNDLVQEGPAPKKGFAIFVQSQQDKAFLYTGSLSSFFILLSLYLAFYKYRRYKQYHTNG